MTTICPYCANAIGSYAAPPKRWNRLAVWGFIMAFLPLPFAGIALCIIALTQVDPNREYGKALAIAGLILRVVSFILGIAVLLLLAHISFGVMEEISAFFEEFPMDDPPLTHAVYWR